MQYDKFVKAHLKYLKLDPKKLPHPSKPLLTVVFTSSSILLRKQEEKESYKATIS